MIASGFPFGFLLNEEAFFSIISADDCMDLSSFVLNFIYYTKSIN